MRSCQVIWMGPYKRCTERDLERKGGDNVMTGAEIGCGHKPKNTWNHQKLKGTRNGVSPRVSIGCVDLPTP